MSRPSRALETPAFHFSSGRRLTPNGARSEVWRVRDRAIRDGMARLDEEVALARDITTLRGLIDRLLDGGLPPDDLGLVAATMLLNEKLETLQASTLDEGR